MNAFRNRLRALTTIWLLCQTVSLSALMPRACCPAHAGDVEASPEDCHLATGADHCPMAGADGQPCPEHAGLPRSSETPCAMRACCDAPAIALSSLVWTLGITVDRLVPVADSSSSLLTVVAERSTPTVLTLESPPPRL